MLAAALLGGATALGATTQAHAAGIQTLQIPADDAGPALKAMVWTPCAEPAEDLKIGPHLVRGRRNCAVAGDHLPLVVISHGHGGEYLGHYDLAEVLADAGFVVVAIDHPGDTHSDMSRAVDLSVFVERPLDIKRVIDYMLTQAPEAGSIDAKKIGFYGFSRGGYTGLVLAGANPEYLAANPVCVNSKEPICEEVRQQPQPLTTLTHDARIKAYVLADPLNEFPQRRDLENVHAPIQLWGSQFGGDGVTPDAVRAVENDLPQRPEFHSVPGSAHFAFLAPCSPAMRKDVPTICIDQGGFDRVAFHAQFNEAVLKFFEANLQ